MEKVRARLRAAEAELDAWVRWWAWWCGSTRVVGSKAVVHNERGAEDFKGADCEEQDIENFKGADYVEQEVDVFKGADYVEQEVDDFKGAD